MQPKSQLTMKDIATMLGVSVATVSRALKDNPSISREQREKIKKFAREHNYFPNVIAEQLRNSKKNAGNLIGVIVPQFVHYYFSSVLSGIEQEASKRGYRILVAQSNADVTFLIFSTVCNLSPGLILSGLYPAKKSTFIFRPLIFSTTGIQSSSVTPGYTVLS